MKSKKTFIVLAAVLAVLLITAAVLYPKLAGSVQPDLPSGNASDTSDTADTDTSNAPAADFTVYDASGAPVRLSAMRGKPVIVNFWATWCPPCRAELPYFDEAFAQYGDRVTFVMVDLTDGYQETQEGAEQFIADNGYSFPVYYDLAGEASQAYQLYSIPQTVAVDGAGNLVFSQIGSLSRDTVLQLAASLAE